jgi:hypothetical protein
VSVNAVYAGDPDNVGAFGWSSLAVSPNNGTLYLIVGAVAAAVIAVALFMARMRRRAPERPPSMTSRG